MSGVASHNIYTQAAATGVHVSGYHDVQFQGGDKIPSNTKSLSATGEEILRWTAYHAHESPYSEWKSLDVLEDVECCTLEAPETIIRYAFFTNLAPELVLNVVTNPNMIKEFVPHLLEREILETLPCGALVARMVYRALLSVGQEYVFVEKSARRNDSIYYAFRSVNYEPQQKSCLAEEMALLRSLNFGTGYGIQAQDFTTHQGSKVDILLSERYNPSEPITLEQRIGRQMHRKVFTSITHRIFANLRRLCEHIAAGSIQRYPSSYISDEFVMEHLSRLVQPADITTCSRQVAPPKPDTLQVTVPNTLDISQIAMALSYMAATDSGSSSSAPTTSRTDDTLSTTQTTTATSSTDTNSDLATPRIQKKKKRKQISPYNSANFAPSSLVDLAAGQSSTIANLSSTLPLGQSITLPSNSSSMPNITATISIQSQLPTNTYPSPSLQEQQQQQSFSTPISDVDFTKLLSSLYPTSTSYSFASPFNLDTSLTSYGQHQQQQPPPPPEQQQQPQPQQQQQPQLQQQQQQPSEADSNRDHDADPASEQEPRSRSSTDALPQTASNQAADPAVSKNYACPHKEAKHYAKGQCNSCYRRDRFRDKSQKKRAKQFDTSNPSSSSSSPPPPPSSSVIEAPDST